MTDSSGWAAIQICEHDGMVAAHVITKENDRIRLGRDSIGEVLFGFFQLTWTDWIENRWRLEVKPVEEVRVMAVCEMHSV